MNIYISGPVTGVPENNLPAFSAAAFRVMDAGHTPIVPHDFVQKGMTWEDSMRVCIRVMMSADAVLVLPGWEGSRGALVEVRIARDIGMPVSEEIPE
jgi:hypothetical protein